MKSAKSKSDETDEEESDDGQELDPLYEEDEDFEND